jgi:hypothetical protein
MNKIQFEIARHNHNKEKRYRAIKEEEQYQKLILKQKKYKILDEVISWAIVFNAFAFTVWLVL